MMRFARPLVLVVLSAAGAVFGAYVASRAMDYSIQDVDGRIYLFGVTPVVAVLAAVALGAAMPRTWSAWRRSMSAVAVTALLSGPVHWWAIREGRVGGGYRVPVDFEPTSAGLDVLERGAWSANRALRGAAINELVRRGATSTEALLRIIGEARKRYGEEYLDDRQVLKAVDALAELGELRIVPVLQEMAGCPSGGGHSGAVVVEEWNRRRAVSMLRNQFGRVEPCAP
jgi:hypothetical protein